MKFIFILIFKGFFVVVVHFTDKEIRSEVTCLRFIASKYLVELRFV